MGAPWQSCLVRTGNFHGVHHNDETYPAQHVMEDMWTVVNTMLVSRARFLFFVRIDALRALHYGILCGISVSGPTCASSATLPPCLLRRLTHSLTHSCAHSFAQLLCLWFSHSLSWQAAHGIIEAPLPAPAAADENESSH